MSHNSASALKPDIFNGPHPFKTLARAVSRVASHNPALAIGCTIILLLLLMALSAPLVSGAILHHSPEAIDLDNILRRPSSGPAVWWLGSDEYGRSQLVRLMYGGRVSLFFSALVVTINLTLGVAIGMLAGYYRGRIDDIINWVITTLVSIPSVILLIAVSVLFRPSPPALALFFGLISWTGVARLVRGQTFSLREREYVTAAYASGASNIRIMLRHIAPNTAPIIITITGIDIASVILTESALSYLGLGIQPPTPSWGSMLTNASSYLFKAGWLVIPPGLCITLTVFCLYIVGDGLRDILDPRLRR